MVLRPRDGGPRAGRRQERLPRRDGLQPGRPRACRCPTASPRPPTPTTASSGTPGWPSGSAGCSTGLDTDDVRRLAEVGKEIRAAVVEQEFPETSRPTSARPTTAWSRSQRRRRCRSPYGRRATAEDLPDASFAGQQETFLNVRGIDAILTAIREVYASLYNDRAIAYRVHHGFAHGDVGALGRRAADGPLRRRRVRRDVHDGHRVRLHRTRCSSPRRTASARASSRAR